MMPSADRCAVFRRLHESGCLVVPNPVNLLVGSDFATVAELGVRRISVGGAVPFAEINGSFAR